MITLKESKVRGHVQWEWLDTYHSFSFGEFYNPDLINFGPLRVLNDDTVLPANGFPMHPHRDMEIVTYVTQGKVQHEDNMGNREIIGVNQVQKMSAGKGILHSEVNPSETETLKLFQVWIIPDKKGLSPYYEMKNFTEQEKENTLYKIASPDGADGSVYISQDAYMYVSKLEAGKTIPYPIGANRGVYVHVVYGNVTIGEVSAQAGDAILVEQERELLIEAKEKSEFLLFDVIME